MADRSFKEYINNRFYDNFFAAVNGFMVPHRKSIDFGSRVVSDVDFAELSDVKVKCVWVDDREDMSIAFDVIIEAEVYIKEYSCRYDTTEDTSAEQQIYKDAIAQQAEVMVEYANQEIVDLQTLADKLGL